MLIDAKNNKSIGMFKHPVKKSNKKTLKTIGFVPKSANQELRYSTDLKYINRAISKKCLILNAHLYTRTCKIKS